MRAGVCRAVLCAGAGLALLALPAAPAGATVSLATGANGVLTVAGTSYGDDVAIQRSTNGTIHVAGLAGEVLAPPAGCVSDMTGVSCTPRPVRVALAGGDDGLTIASVLAPTGGDPGSFTVDLGPGNDLVTDSGPGGAQSIDGGAGRDTVTYERQTRVEIDLRASRSSGAPGERDLLRNVEHAVGGLGDDRLIGGPKADTLDGADGDDTITGGAGGDELTGGPGSDRLRGASGADKLYGGNGDEWPTDGDVGDDLKGESGGDLLNGDQGADRLSGGSGNDTIELSTFRTVFDEKDNEEVVTEVDGELETPRCGKGSRDVVSYTEANDRLARDCEAAQPSDTGVTLIRPRVRHGSVLLRADVLDFSTFTLVVRGATGRKPNRSTQVDIERGEKGVRLRLRRRFRKPGKRITLHVSSGDYRGDATFVR